MTRYALFHEPPADGRSLTILRKNDVVKDLEMPPVDELILAVITDDAHPARVATSPGPVVYYSLDDNLSRQAFPVTDLFFNPDVKVRRIALAYFKRMSDLEPQVLDAPSKDAIASLEKRLVSSGPKRWRDAAIRIADALHDDFLLNLAGMRQCHALAWGEGVRKWLRLLLRPSLPSLDPLASQIITSATDQLDEVKSAISNSVLKAESLRQVCDNYYRRLGHLPLGGTFSLGGAVADWIGQSGRKPNAWKQIWAWADEMPSPLAHYHACTVFTQHPEFVPAGKHRQLWERILDVIEVPGTDAGTSEWTLGWLMWHELARHYACYLECHIPNSDSERLSGFAWWLADAVSSVIGKSRQAIDYLMKTTIIPEAGNFAHVRQLAHPVAKTSMLRYATLCIRSPWALGLTCEMGPGIARLKPELLDAEVRESIGGAIELNLLSCFPLRAKSDDQVVYAFDRTVVPTAKAWSELGEDAGSTHPFATLLEHYPKITNPNDLANALGSILNEQEGGQLLVAQNIRALAYTGGAPVSRIWECMQDEQWRRDVWLKLEPVALETLFESVAEIQAQNDDKWTSHLPHFLALACEAVSEEKEREELIFAFTLAASMQTGTVSAVERLLRGEHKDRFAQYVAGWRDRLLSLMPLAPGWIAGRMRAVMASLYVAE